jgi:DNA-binding CsgD family transcriptional regulator
MPIYSEDIVAELIARIYDAVLDPAGWSIFLEHLGTVVDGHSLNLSLMDPLNGNIVYGVHAKSDPRFVENYRRHYYRIDPWGEEGRKRNLLRPGFIGLGEPIVPPKILKRTEFYNDFGRQFSACGGLSALFKADHSLLAVSMMQYKFGQFGQLELRLVRELTPHLERAMRIHVRLEGAGMISERATAALDRVNCGVLFVAASGKLLFANQFARRLLRSRDGLTLTGGELHANTPAHTARLREAMSAALRVREGSDTADMPPVVIQRLAGRRPLSIVIAPLPHRPSFTAFDGAAVALFVTDPERSVTPRVETIGAMLGLSPGEAHLAQLLATGHDLKQASDRLSIQLETARKRLKVIFHKTDTHRQSDLVKLVLLCAEPSY